MSQIQSASGDNHGSAPRDNEPEVEPEEVAQLLDWKRAIFALYARVRDADDPEQAWSDWVATRSFLFRTHPQSPVPPERRDGYPLEHFPYDPALRTEAEVRSAPPEAIRITTSGASEIAFTRFAVASFALQGRDASLDLYWLDSYGGGLFLPFRDATSGEETYGAGRYLLDTVKGADLGMKGGRLVLDFNFAYNPSCSYDDRWVCPLAPPANRLEAAVRAGERTTTS